MIYDVDAPVWVELRRSTQKARKQYRCQSQFPAHNIEPGQQYRSVIGVEDGCIFTFRECVKCPVRPCRFCRGEGHDAEIGGRTCPHCKGYCVEFLIPSDGSASDRATDAASLERDGSTPEPSPRGGAE